MRTGTRRIATVAATLCVALVAAGTGYACGGSPSAGAAFASFKNSHNRGAHSLLAVTAGYLGVDRSALKRDLASGKTLAQVAPAGKTAAGLADAFGAALKAKLDTKVAAGKLSAADETTLLAKITPKLAPFAAMLWTKHWTGGEKRSAARHHHHKDHHRGH